ncbi:DUF547 domain-containing protein [uncultured Winogradskyella sp.]|uniref:DUF547 domain-containing protein n=1 Tax=uncultured Winogradskyella sp. TaxID=395353 RepID=UPI00260A326B|nr:DUF547 domain-containing protein [uncultured Winogradskyella sp.]
MKYFSILILTIFVSSCCSTKKVVKTQPETTKEIAVVTEIPDVSEVPPTIPELPKPTEPLKVEEVEEEKILVNNETTPESFDHVIWKKLLENNVSDNGNVNYKGFKSESNKLRTYIDSLKDNMPNDNWTKKDKLAYWINTYNALTIDLIIRNYPLKSIKDIKDPWDQRLWKFGDKWLNLNDIEHQILRKMDEPRIHFAIVCASESCPKLQNEAFTSNNLEEQLANATIEFLADVSKNEISEDEIKLSKIFKWFKKDFEQNGSLIDFLNQYSDITISGNAKKSFKDYSWDLNN